MKTEIDLLELLRVLWTKLASVDFSRIGTGLLMVPGQQSIYEAAAMNRRQNVCTVKTGQQQYFGNKMEIPAGKFSFNPRLCGADSEPSGC